MTSRADRIDAKLRAELAPTHLEVVNESHLHSVAPGSETHFKLVVVSPAFTGASLVARHRRINDLMRDELAAGLHALSIHAFAPAEYDATLDTSSPACRGGAGK
jgi:BolA family transcriptional regulator, general stress-responsive regulator